MIAVKLGPSTYKFTRGTKSIQVISKGTGPVKIDIEVSNNKTDFFTIATFELLDNASDGLASSDLARWKYIRINVKEMDNKVSRAMWFINRNPVINFVSILG